MYFKKYFMLSLLIYLFLLYAPAINSPYFLDDTHSIQNNSGIQTPSNFFKLWGSARYFSALPANSTYRPLVTMSNLLLWQVADGKTWPFHVYKLFIYFLFCLIVFRIWRILFPKCSDEAMYAGLLLFAINPVQTQVVIYLSALSELYAGLFVCLSLWLYLLFREFKKPKHLILSCACVFLALLAKEIGFIPLLLIPLIEVYLNKAQGNKLDYKKLFKISAIYLVPVLLAGALLILNHEVLADSIRGDTSRLTYFITQWRAYLRYLAMFFVSYDLNFDNLAFGFSTRIFEPKVLLALFLNISLLILSVFVLNKRWALLGLAIGWFYLSIAPSSSIWVLAEPVNDHRAFIANVGLALINLLLLDSFYKKRKKLFFIIVTVIFCSYSWATWNRSLDWSTGLALGRDTVKKNPSSGRAYNNLAVSLMALAQYKEAYELLQKCITTNPNYTECYINLGITSAAVGRDDEAEKSFARAVDLDRRFIISRHKWAGFLLARGFFQRPIQLLTAADDYASGKNLDVRLSLIKALHESGAAPRAAQLWRDSATYFKSNPSYIALGYRIGLDQ